MGKRHLHVHTKSDTQNIGKRNNGLSLLVKVEWKGSHFRFRCPSRHTTLLTLPHPQWTPQAERGEGLQDGGCSSYPATHGMQLQQPDVPGPSNKARDNLDNISDRFWAQLLAHTTASCGYSCTTYKDQVCSK
ncbi:Hypothetical predicted protein [Pelobates cultripes]|uniref:Uncharacterized protein n=1 Tax=Pelobates cultripes TaxID=61616 RepID=A0AAD1W1L2_PELCU|nr:Hypothetical predicted protein [Pelobates cultripes]